MNISKKQLNILWNIESIFHNRLFIKEIEHYACNIVKKNCLIYYTLN